MRARAVIGANFGDEGKGLVTDYLCAKEGAGVVVRFNGGAQAGHTVVLPNNVRHVFHHIGSGTLAGVPTYLSSYFIINPVLFAREYDDLLDLGYKPDVFAHPSCLVTTFADMIINQRQEESRGDKRHGSVGVGINETVVRSSYDSLRITMGDLWNGVRIKGKLEEICTKYAEFRTGSVIPHAEEMIQAFIAGCEVFAEVVAPLGMGQVRDPVFEGAQGLLLDKDNKKFFPHVTRSNTGSKNVRALCVQAGIEEKDIEFYYVSRTYLTRHGAGHLPDENPNMKFHDDTNVDHPFQGNLRFAPLDVGSLLSRCNVDAAGPYKLVMTHCDQLEPVAKADLYAFGPTRNSVFTSAESTKIGVAGA